MSTINDAKYRAPRGLIRSQTLHIRNAAARAVFAALLTIPVMPSYAQVTIGQQSSQAGSTGGSIGKQDKSASGQSESQARPAPTAKPPIRTRATSRESNEKPSSGACASLTSHRWSSWAAGMFGAGDTTFETNGTTIHRSGIRGKWSCSGGRIKLQWPGEETMRNMTFSEDGKSLLGEGKQIRFSRGE